MATNRRGLMAYEFAENGSVLGRATLLGTGMIELDFPDPELRGRFESYLSRPRDHGGPVFELTHTEKVWPDESRLHFSEACLSMVNLYKVRRVL